MRYLSQRADYVLPAAVSGVLASLSVLWFLANAVAPWGPGWVGWVFAPLVIAVNEAQMVRLMRTPGMSPEGRRFWRHLVIAQVLLVAATMVTAWDTLTNPRAVALTEPALALNGLVILVVLWGLLRLPARDLIRGTAVVRFGLDAAVVVLTVGLLGWHLLFRFHDGVAGPAFGLVLFACAAALAFAKLAIAGAGGINRRTLYHLGACVVIAALVGGLLPQVAARPDLNAIAVSVPVTFFLFGLAIERERSVLGRVSPPRRASRPFSVTPYLAVAATDGLLLYTRGNSMAVIVVAVALTAIVVIRQILVLHDNSRLLRERDASLAEVREAQLLLAHQANHDALTGLVNRRFFEARLAAALVSAEPFAVALIDLDNFKGVNDRLGHHVGDGLLVTVGQRLLSSVGDGDVVARLGGDEFALLLGAESAAEAGLVLDRLNTAMASPVVIDGNELPVGCSVGLADGVVGAGAVEILRRADVAMYAAKAAGKGRSARYEPAMA
ncbi:MAG TPA: GGDEF domain-containing protein [Actinoplanes sp.]|nr:GGDEF domain-containing protein [Actinoplanes sp.]